MMCGYPGEDRQQRPNENVDWGMLGVTGIVRCVSENQITCIRS